MKQPPSSNAALVFADGRVFFGNGIGALGTRFGEICFNTAMTGYQEVLTDPSYAGQIITFTFPHIGNVGTNAEDIEAHKPVACGLVVREDITAPSNFRQLHDFNAWLVKHGISGISGVDTRAITRHIRVNGATNCAIVHVAPGDEIDLVLTQAQLGEQPSLEGLDLALEVSTRKPYEWNQTRWALEQGYGTLSNSAHHVVAVGYGEKLNILRSLASVGCKITVVPADYPAEKILALKPDGIFLSNGPGDPAATGEYALPIIKKLIDSGIPIFGICLGHQLLGLALGCTTEKMHQGHRGANHPVKNIKTARVEITSQNHGFMVSAKNLPANVEITHVSLFDGTVQGLRATDKPIFCVQYHPESSPGPHDSVYLFEQFVQMMKEKKNA